MNSNIPFPIPSQWLMFGLDVVGIWLLGLVILVILGLRLSYITLHSTTYSQAKSASRIGLKDFVIREIYRLVILVACLYFYVSIPILIGILIAAAVGVFHLWRLMLDSDAEIPIYFLLVPLLFSLSLLFSAFQIVFSLFVSIVLPLRHKLVGRPLPRNEAPDLWKLTDEVAARIGTRPISQIYCRPEMLVAVNEKGNLLFRIFGISKRCLYLGLGALPEMTQGQLRSILAHEYGHFAHRDTAGGGIALQVHSVIADIVISLKSEGMATWTNPAWLFVFGYHFLFWYITLGATRWQEVLADRLAILSYGSHDFIASMNHIERQEYKFNLQLSQEFRAAVKEKRAVQNVYTLPALEPKWEKEITLRMQHGQRNTTQAFDSHPAIPDRIQMAQAMNAPETVENNAAPVWDLLPADQLQMEMTEYLTRKILGHGEQIQYALEG